MKIKGIILTFALGILLASGFACGEKAPTVPDSDGDGWTDFLEQSVGTDPYSVDSDGDGQWDPYDFDPLDPNIPVRTTTPTPTPTPTPTLTLTPTPTPSLALKDMLVKLDELPAGWFQAAFQQDMRGEYRIDGVRVVFRNKKYAAHEEEISVANSVFLCEEEQAAAFLLDREKSHFHPVRQVSLGDDGLFGCSGAPHCEIHFVEGPFWVILEYYGTPLGAISEAEKFEFLQNLAQQVAARIRLLNLQMDIR